MLSYVLEWLEAAFVKDVLLVTHVKSSPQIANYLSKIYESSSPNTQTNVQVIEFDTYYETAEVLRQLKDKIKVDFVFTA